MPMYFSNPLPNQFVRRVSRYFHEFPAVCLRPRARRILGLAIPVLLGLSLPGRAADAPDAAAAPQVVIPPYLTAEEELKTFTMPEGYSLELVMGDPVIKEPVLAVFDGNGRMFVAEMRSYMQDADGSNERVPTSRISMHWSSKGDGVFDKHSVFIDNLILPRMILPMADGILVNVTDSQDLWLYRDTKGTGVADKKELIFAGGPRGGNLEHQQSGLIWDRDNWIYQAVNAYRLRIIGTNVIKEATPGDGGQWGINQDDYGKLVLVSAGDEQGPKNFQVPILYGGLKVRSEPTQGFMAVWPLVGLADVQGGRGRFRPDDKTLNHITSCAGDDFFRGDALPADIKGDLFFGEPVGRLIRRAKVENVEGLTHLTNPYERSEFIRSTDAKFRCVNTVSAPDGTLYFVDMYRGIIQESEWTRRGSYLRPMIEKFQLQNNIGRGRIWRLRYKGMPLDPQPHMLDETPTQLVQHLNSANGWWRDTAQKLIVLRQDKSVVPALAAMSRNNPNPLTRLDALWTLEGLDSADPALLREKLKDSDGHVRTAAIRVSETLCKKGDESLVPDITAMSQDPDPNVVVQVMLTANYLHSYGHWPTSTNLVHEIIASNKSQGVQELGPLIHPPVPQVARGGGRGRGGAAQAAELAVLTRGESIYKELCYSCHGDKGEGRPVDGGKPGETMAPPFVSNKFANELSDGIISVVLKGLDGPVMGKTYTAKMVPMESNDDTWVAAVTSYVRNNFGNSAPLVTPQDVARVRAAIKEHKDSFTLEELAACMPQPMTDHAGWKITASHGAETAPLAVDGDKATRFTSASRPGAGDVVPSGTAPAGHHRRPAPRCGKFHG